MSIAPDMVQITRLQDDILTRYDEYQRDLPWRQTRDPYRILVSEVMSQQTQVARVIPKYHAFLQQAPTVHDLAVLDRQTLLQLRVGLGFNSRAIRLQKAGQHIVESHQGSVPESYQDLLSLPGVGPYTAAAVCAFAYNQDVPVVDINIKRVLITKLNLDKEISDADLRQIAFVAIPSGQSRLWHNALMDYGAMVCTAKKTGIRSTPQSRFVGSDREVRGRILKQLVADTIVTIDTVQQQFPKKKVADIIQKMQGEGLISLDGNQIQHG